MGTYNLTLTNPTFVASTMGQAISNCYGSTSASPTPTSGFWAMACRFNILNIASGPKMLGGQTKVGWWAMNANGTIQCNYGFTAEATVITPAGTRYDDGADHEAWVVFNASGATILVDGAVKANNAKTFDAAGPGTPPGAFFVGNFTGDAGYTWPGTIDQFAIYSGARSSAAYTPSASPIPTTDPGLVALWNFNGNGLDTAGVTDTTAPTITAAAVANSAPTIVALTASEVLDGSSVPAASAFTVSGHTVSSVAISGTVINLTVTPAFANGEAARTVSYAQPGTNNARDAAANLLANFTGQAITNNVAAAGDTTPPAFASAQVTNLQPTVILVTMNEALAASVPPNSAFTPSGGRTVTGISISGAVASVTVNTAYTSADTITIAYTQPGANPRLQDAAGNATSSFTAQPVTNNVAATGGNALTNGTAKVLFSPLNWNVGASSAKTINAGAAFRTIFGGTSCTLSFDVSTLIAPFPEVRYRVDGYGPWTTQTLAASIVVAMPADTADYANKPGHLLEFEVKSTTENQNRWNGTSNMVSLTGIALDTGKSLSLPPSKPLRGLFYGDSITEGCRTVKPLGTPDTASHDGSLSWAAEVARILGAELGLVGFSATSWNSGGVGNVPSFGNNYSQLYSGVARSFTNAPDFIVIAHGHNDGTVSTTTTQTNVLNGLLAATPATTHIFLVRPLSVPEQGAYMQAAIAACSAPARCHYVNTAGFFTSANSSDNVHPYGVENITHIAPLVAAQIRPVLLAANAGAGTSTPPTLTQRTVTLTLTSGKDANQNPIPAANLTGIKVAVYDEASTELRTVPRYQSAVQTTNASGVLSFSYGSTLAAGAKCGVTVELPDGRNFNYQATVA